jgi:hypothetical protein
MEVDSWTSDTDSSTSQVNGYIPSHAMDIYPVPVIRWRIGFQAGKRIVEQETIGRSWRASLNP